MPHRYAEFSRECARAISGRIPATDSPDAVNFLVISDLHGSNRLALVQAIIDAERDAGRPVSAVLILGDLANFGFPLELRLRRLRSSLARLRIPVLIIPGNHDKHAPADTSVARYLSKAPNVRMMQRGGAYSLSHFGPISIGGFDDPRYFGDDNTNIAKRQRPARDAFLREVRRRGAVPDLVMVHEPYATGDDDVLWLNGHMHSPSIDPAERRVQVGMLTDGVFYYNRRVHRRAPSHFALLAARPAPGTTTVASVTFRWEGRVPHLSNVQVVEMAPAS